MKVRACRFVSLSEMFDGLPLALSVFVENDQPFSWGDNTHSLVLAGHIADALEASRSFRGTTEESTEVCKALNRLRSFDTILVDLET